MAIRYLAVSVLILLLIGTASPQPPVEPGFMTGITGHVVDASGMGISGARVWAIGGDGQAVNTTTNGTGYYGIEVPAGNYTITAELSGYSFTSSSVQVQAGAVSGVQRIAGYAAGTTPVVGAAPVVGTAATVPAATTTPMVTTPVATSPVTTTPITITPTGFYQYGQVYAPGYSYSLGGNGWVQGRIADQSGGGIPFASIRVDGFPAAATDELGNYRLELSPGMHTIDAAKSGYGIPPRVVFISSGQTSRLDIIAKGTVALGSIGRR